ncbi:MAG: sugar transferase [Humidesulfovibrio sp.]|nr:sugar transferase [Humidesulfovibrio sp.]
MTAKRLLDLALALPGLVLLAPVFFAVALAVRLRLGPGVLFRQERPGLHGKPFFILKFRTMLTDPGTDAERLTPFGRFLRGASLDELPELWNVLRGDMSLVGPRPLLMRYLPRYTPQQARRHEVLPGITGWAQVNGRNALSWEEKFALDVWYVDNRSLALDLAILWRTVLAVALRRGISAPGEATMSEFLGSPPEAGRPGPEFLGSPPESGEVRQESGNACQDSGEVRQESGEARR